MKLFQATKFDLKSVTWLHSKHKFNAKVAHILRNNLPSDDFIYLIEAKRVALCMEPNDFVISQYN